MPILLLLFRSVISVSNEVQSVKSARNGKTPPNVVANTIS